MYLHGQARTHRLHSKYLSGMDIKRDDDFTNEIGSRIRSDRTKELCDIMHNTILTLNLRCRVIEVPRAVETELRYLRISTRLACI